MNGARILVAEDEILIALDIGSILEDAGAQICGPATTLSAGMRMAKSEALTAATLDVRLGRETTEAIAMILDERGIPFIFYTGQALPAEMHCRWPDCPIIVKPAGQETIVAVVAGLLNKTPSRV